MVFGLRVSGGPQTLPSSRLGVISASHAVFHVAERPEQTLVVYHPPGSP